jgi:hypothetical protein
MAGAGGRKSKLRRKAETLRDTNRIAGMISGQCSMLEWSGGIAGD